MSNYKRPVIIWGNSFYINIELKQFNKDTSDYEYFDLTKCHDVKVNLICATHNTVIPLEWNLLDGYNYIIRCFVDYRLLHNTSYGIEVEGLNEDDIHWRWYMLPKEGLLVVNNSSGLNIPDEVTTVDLAGRVGWGIQTDGDLTNYYTKTEVNNLINESTDNSPYVLECWQEIDEDLRKTLAEYIQNSRDIILHEGDGADLKLFEYTIGGDNEVEYMVFHGDMGEEGSSEVTQYYWRIPYDQEANNGWSVSVIDFLTSDDRMEVTWDGVAISDGAEDPTYTYKIWGNHTWKDFIDIVNEGKTIQLAIHPEDQNSVRAGYRGVPDYTVTLFTCFSAINVITTYFYAVLYNYFEWEGRVTSNGLYVYVLRVDPDKTEYPNDQTKWKIKLTEERIDTIEMQKKTNENTEQIDNIELDTNNNNLILQTTLDETPKVFSRVGMKTINNQTLFGEGNIDIQGGGGGSQGPQGPQGEQGPQGPQGPAGTTDYDELENKPTFKTINGESILGEGDIEIEGGDTVEPAKIIVTDEEVQDPDPDAVYIVQKPIELKTINGEEIVGTGNIEISGGEQGDVPELITIPDVNGKYVSSPDLKGIVQKTVDENGTGDYYILGFNDENKPVYRHILLAEDTDTGEIVSIEDPEIVIKGDVADIIMPFDDYGAYVSSIDYPEDFKGIAINPSEDNYQIIGFDENYEPVIRTLAREYDTDLQDYRILDDIQHIATQEGIIADIQNDIDNLEDDIAVQQAEIGGVQTAISGHQTAIQNQATEISGMQTVVAGHQSALETQATEISGIQSNISGMQTEISGIQTVIAGHQTAIQNQATEISGMQTVLAGHQTALENQSGVTQVQSDWSQTDTTAVDYIKNKPSIPAQAIDQYIIEFQYDAVNKRLYMNFSTAAMDATGTIYQPNRLNSASTMWGNIKDNKNLIFSVWVNNTLINTTNFLNAIVRSGSNHYLPLPWTDTTSNITIDEGLTLTFNIGTWSPFKADPHQSIYYTIPVINPVSSSTSGLKIEVVSALPSTVDQNTIYIIQ